MNEKSPASEEPRLRADARRNREQVLAAAREVFVEHGPGAPLEEVARRAGVGIGTLYRRFPDRATLVRAVAADVLTEVAHEIRLAHAEEPSAFRALARYMHRALDLRVGVVMPILVSASPGEDEALHHARQAVTAQIQAMLDTAQAEGELRPDVVFGDIGMLIVRLARPLPGPLPRDLDEQLAHRHLDLLLDGLRADPNQPRVRLPDPAMTLADLRRMASEIAEVVVRDN